ncbi:hypothetical protein CLM82_00135, partial [Streptomyces albidoflavus]
MESPEWWLDRLYDQLQARIDYVARMRSYCSGNHPLPTLPDKARSAFQKLLRHARSNYVGLVADATSERIQVDGFRLGGAEVGDEELWRIWQANSMDADSDMLIGEAVRV